MCEPFETSNKSALRRARRSGPVDLSLSDEQSSVGSAAAPPSGVPKGYREGIVTAITVFLGFSLTFITFWALEKPGNWTAAGTVPALLFGAGILVQLAALYRALDVRDDEPARYRKTVKTFFVGAIIVVVGLVTSVLVSD